MHSPWSHSNLTTKECPPQIIARVPTGQVKSLSGLYHILLAQFQVLPPILSGMGIPEIASEALKTPISLLVTFLFSWCRVTKAGRNRGPVNPLMRDFPATADGPE